MNSSRWTANPTLRQCCVVFPILLSKVSFGMAFGFSTVFLAAIHQPHSTINMDINMASWFVSVLGMALCGGYVLSPWLIARLGRRRGFAVTCAPAAGAVLLALVPEVWALVASRALTGATLGGVGITAGVIIAEYTSPANRGMFLTLGTVSLNLGILLMHFCGNYLHWRTLAILIPVPIIACALLIILTWPESPSWLAQREQYDKSREAFYWLRGRTEETTKEIEELIRAQVDNDIDNTVTNNCAGYLRKFKKKNFWKPLLITALCAVMIETSGRHIIPSYAVQLLEQTAAGPGGALYATSLIDVLIVVSGVSASYLMRVMRIRTLLFSTGCATVVALCLVSVTFYLYSAGVLSEQYRWVPLVLFGVYCVLTNLGCSCVPFTLFGEIYPLEHRAVGCVVIGLMASAVTTVALKVTPYVLLSRGAHGALGALAAGLALNLIPLYFILPETKNRTLQEIDDYYKYGKFRELRDTVDDCDGGDESKSLKSSCNDC